MTASAFESFMHFDPLTLIVIIVGLIAGWQKLKGSTTWHSQWIKKHSEECDKREEQTAEVLVELKTIAARVVAIVDSHAHRIDRIENQIDRVK